MVLSAINQWILTRRGTDSPFFTFEENPQTDFFLD